MGEATLEELISQLLRQRGLTLATAESCTGGLLGHRVTNVPGSSDYYLGGVIAYANAVKESVLGVSREALATYGAVSAPVAREMARGVRLFLGADIGVSVTGIAGPGGGSADKPVGLVYVGLSVPGGEWVERHQWDGDRLTNKARSADAALELLRRYLEGYLTH